MSDKKLLALEIYRDLLGQVILDSLYNIVYVPDKSLNQKKLEYKELLMEFTILDDIIDLCLE